MSTLQTLDDSRSSADPTPPRARPSALRAPVLVGAVVFLLSAVYVSYFVYRGWIPHDEGLLAQSAERVLNGEMPHRDFDESYTGGLTYLHSLAFTLGGIRFTTIRTTLAIFVLCYIVGVYLIALRCAPPLVAGVTTFACVVWTVPNYFAALPSWHVLVFWIFGTLALMRYADTQRRRWLWLAGLCGGCAVVIKITGLYYIAVALLFLAYHEQLTSRKRDFAGGEERSKGFAMLMTLDCFTLVGLVILLLSRHLAMMEILIFVVPCAMICLTLAINEWTEGYGPFRTRFGRLLTDVAVLVAGILPPVVALLAPYIASGALGDMWFGVFVQPHLRFVFEREPLQPLQTLLPILLPAALLLVWGLRRPLFGSVTIWVIGAVAIGVAALLLLKPDGRFWFYWNFFSVRNLPPVVVGIVCAVLLFRRDANISIARRQDLFLLAAGAAFGGLIQYPFSVLIYFCYFAPLLLLAIHYLLTVQTQIPRWFQPAFMGCLILVGLHLNSKYCMEYPSSSRDFTHLLDLERGQLFIREVQKDQYENVIEMVRQCTSDDAAILATPDCPEIYFLADRRNPTRTMFDFFDDSDGRDERLIQLVDELDIPVVVVNLRPLFSDDVSVEFSTALRKRFPVRRAFGNLVVCARGPAALQFQAKSETESNDDRKDEWATVPIAVSNVLRPVGQID